MDQTWQMQACNLDTTHVDVQHTVDNKCGVPTKLCDEWGIANKTHAVVTDNAANMVSAVKKSHWKHIPCFSHTLKLVVKDAIKTDTVLDSILEECGAIVKFFHQSTKASD